MQQVLSKFLDKVRSVYDRTFYSTPVEAMGPSMYSAIIDNGHHR